MRDRESSLKSAHKSALPKMAGLCLLGRCLSESECDPGGQSSGLVIGDVPEGEPG